MKYTFINGTDQQQSLWRQGAVHLLNLPFADLPMEIEVSFVAPETLSKQTTLAETDWTYGSVHSTTQVRNDFPGFGNAEEGLKADAAGLGLTWSGVKFAIETSAHELAHAAFAALPEEARLAVVEMFGADSDDPDELSPPGTQWQNRIIEGIAETFKEAFLPRRFRVFPNRSNRRIPYYRFPEFRSHWRRFKTVEGGEEIGESGWFRNPRVDAMRYGAIADEFFLPAPYPEKGKSPSGLYYTALHGTTTTSPPIKWRYLAYAAANWSAHLADAVEVRNPIEVPSRAEFFEFDPEDKVLYVGDAAAFGVFGPELWLGGTESSYLANAEIEVKDDDGDRYAIHWVVSLSYGQWTKFAEPEKGKTVKGYAGDTGEKHFKKNGVTIDSSEFPVAFETQLAEHGMSGLEIFQAFEALGESPNYDVNKVPYEMRVIENNVRYVFPESATLNQVPFPEGYRDFAWNRMQELWVCPLSEDGGESEGVEVEIAEPPPSSVEPEGFQRGTRPRGQPVSGSRV